MALCAELHELVDRLPDEGVDGAAILGEISGGRIDPERAWFRRRNEHRQLRPRP
jgi:hypothetical protein